MGTQILIVAEGAKLDAEALQSALQSVPELVRTRRLGPQRGVATGIASVVKWTAEFVGSSSKIVDGLTQAVLNKAAGATVKIQIGSNIVEVSNVNRGQLIQLLDKAAQIASSTAER